MDPATETVVIGRITGIYGIKGWFKVHSYTEPMENLLHYSEALIGSQGHWREVTWDEGRRHGKGLVAHIAGVDDRDQARALVGLDIAIPTERMPALEAGEYYWYQLEGLRVLGPDEQLLGQVDHLLATGANDVLVVKSCPGSIDARERLIPWLPDQVVTAVDLAAGEIHVDWDPDF